MENNISSNDILYDKAYPLMMSKTMSDFENKLNAGSRHGALKINYPVTWLYPFEQTEAPMIEKH